MKKFQFTWLVKELQGRMNELKQREARHANRQQHREADILAIKQEELQIVMRLVDFATKLKP